MGDELMYIHNDDTKNTPSVDYYNYRLKLWDAEFYEPINQNSIKVPKVDKLTIMKTL